LASENHAKRHAAHGNADHLAAQRDGIVADACDTVVELGGGAEPARSTGFI